MGERKRKTVLVELEKRRGVLGFPNKGIPSIYDASGSSLDNKLVFPL
jgi:hypothetical protein